MALKDLWKKFDAMAERDPREPAKWENIVNKGYDKHILGRSTEYTPMHKAIGIPEESLKPTVKQDVKAAASKLWELFKYSMKE